MTQWELKLWRHGQLWTQPQAARALGVSVATYKRYELGNSVPELVRLAALALETKNLLRQVASVEKEKRRKFSKPTLQTLRRMYDLESETIASEGRDGAEDQFNT
ncbi:helix-turn-helix domain-containing protein [Salmonella enterica subsp. enterica serovar Legon]|nr:XRE family transcriptional regulator [Salmonella enterica subsp. enterica serovar Weybridge]EDS6807014.1 helix-turn-helix domain-containing protein [Salmonella enterica subsp. enterica serovar Legon]EDW9825348.1 helix-turn-helix domain-containing protein [Salmonella enterica]EDZ3589397.1 helix-turn-helix domain-containing protein [Salmonella enterica subsp. enterica serovar Wagenia]EHL5833691.1 helix-turn-helix transcriptional regulator [Salmonella enterica]